LVKKKLLKEKKRVKKIKYRVKKLNFDEIIKDFREYFSKIPDSRRMPQYPIEDIVISVFAMMFFQDPSMLAFQNRMKERLNKNNLETLFRVKNIPSDGTIRNVLDKIDPSFLEDAFFIIFRSLERSGVLKDFLSIDDSYTIAIDGTQYFTSYKCHCDKCLTTQKKGQPIRYYHNVLQATLVDLEQKFVIPLMSEEIVNDNDEKSEEITSAKKLKQDSEHKVAERLLREVRKALPKLKIIILGDDLYSHEPMINLLKELDMSFILTAKSSSHKELSEFLKGEKSYIENKTSRSTFNISKKIMLQRLKIIGKTKNDLKAPEVKKRYYKQVQVSEYRYYNGDAPINRETKKIVIVKTVQTHDKLTKVYQSINASYVKNIKPIFEKKCFDCHGTITQLPWYFNIPGIKQMIEYDMKEAKKHLDMSKGFPFVSHETPLKDLESLREASRENTMPPLRYILGHWDSSLSEMDKKSIDTWTQESIQKIRGVRYE